MPGREQAGTAHGQVKQLKIGETKGINLQNMETVKAGGGLLKPTVKWEGLGCSGRGFVGRCGENERKSVRSKAMGRVHVLRWTPGLTAA